MADIKLSSRRCEEIKKIVVEMFVKYGVCCVPINGFEIASKMGVITILMLLVKPKHTSVHWDIQNLMLKVLCRKFIMQ